MEPWEIYVNALLGGMLLGAAAALKTWFTGGVLGCSGALKAAVRLQTFKSISFVLGVVGGSFIAFTVTPNSMLPYHGLDNIQLFGGGLLVGLGTFSANGCTSGHGITGMSRLSRRSLVSTMTFFITGLLTATISHSRTFVTLPQSPEQTLEGVKISTLIIGMGASLAAFGLIYVLRRIAPSIVSEKTSGLMTELVAGIAFSFGLIGSGMNQPSTVLDFLDLRSDTWSAALALVLVGAICIKATIYYGVTSKSQDALLGGKISLPCTRRKEDASLFLGSIIFGVGWGLTGLCPGPGMTMLASQDPIPGVSFMAGLLLAYLVLGVYDSNKESLDRYIESGKNFGSRKGNSKSEAFSPKPSSFAAASPKATSPTPSAGLNISKETAPEASSAVSLV